MKDLIIGSGGREHAIAWKIHAQNPDHALFMAPGNAGTARLGENLDIKVDDIQRIGLWVYQNDPAHTIIGPELPLSLGLVDELAGDNTKTFGPTRKAAKLEWSKVFAKNFMVNNKIPTAKFKVFDSLPLALIHIRSIDYPFVIKASGLAAGKGVVIPESKEAAKQALIDILDKKSMGSAGYEIVIEEKLEGKELSVMAFTDGNSISVMPYARDHKRLLNGDKGPNTGGMGAFAPVDIDSDTRKSIERNILQETIYAMQKDGTPFEGVLYAGIILTKGGPQVLEFNSRFGDPEAQVVLPLLDTNILEIGDAIFHKELHRVSVQWKKGAAVCVVAAAENYPGAPKTGEIILNLDTVKDHDVHIFHAGTIMKEGKILTNGGRVIGAAAYADNLTLAIQKANAALGWNGIHFRGMQHRTDIGATK